MQEQICQPNRTESHIIIDNQIIGKQCKSRNVGKNNKARVFEMISIWWFSTAPDLFYLELVNNMRIRLFWINHFKRIFYFHFKELKINQKNSTISFVSCRWMTRINFQRLIFSWTISTVWIQMVAKMVSNNTNFHSNCSNVTDDLKLYAIIIVSETRLFNKLITTCPHWIIPNKSVISIRSLQNGN